MRISMIVHAIAFFLIAMPAVAADYPERAVRLIVPFSPGGATDIVARLLAQKLAESWGQQVVVDNRAGAGGNIGAELVAKAAPDGYTLLMPAGSVITANQYIYAKLAFDAEKDFAAITNVASGPQVIAVANGVPAKSVKELIALAKERTLTFGSAGVSTQTHLAAESFLFAAKVNATHIPYKGEGPALTDLAGGQIDLIAANLAAGIGFVKAGRIRALAVTSRERNGQLPDVATVAETLPGFENLGWFGLVAPAATPKAVIAAVHAATVKLLQSGEFRKRLDELGMAPVGNTPEAFAGAIKLESAHWARIVRERRLAVN